MTLPAKSGRNHHGYHGERVDIRVVLDEVRRSATVADGWQTEILTVQGAFELVALRRAMPLPGARRAYVSAGIHGDEPAGPLAVLHLLREGCFPDGLDLTLLPCLNPVGFTQNRRENPRGADLNRDYRAALQAESRAHIAWLERQGNFDLALCLHEDWEANGFYLYEVNPDGLPTLAPAMIAAATALCPMDPGEVIEGRRAEGGIIRPTHLPLERLDWPEALYLIQHHTRLCYTLEAPSDFPLPARVAALVAATRAALEGLAR